MASGFLRLKQPHELLASSSALTATAASAAGATTTKRRRTTARTWTEAGVSIVRDSAPTSTSANTPSCVMWIHLQTPISTEWAHSSMVKRPQTIHRCILQNTNQQSGSNSSQMPLKARLTCHVCGFDYDSYQKYIQHLLDASCVKGKASESTINASTSAGLPGGAPKTPNTPKRESKVMQTWTNLCPHFAAATQTSPVNLDDFLYDEATMATLKVELTTLMAGILGEDRLTSLGYPEKDILTILTGLLQMAQCPPVKEGCSAACARLESVLNPIQVKYRKLKSQLAVARLNTMRLLEICLPDPSLWKAKKWIEKPVEVILAEIIHNAGNTPLHTPVVLID